MSGRKSEPAQKPGLVEQLGREGNLVEEDLDDMLELPWAWKMRRPAGRRKDRRESARKIASVFFGVAPREIGTETHPGHRS